MNGYIKDGYTNTTLEKAENKFKKIKSGINQIKKEGKK